MRIGWRSPIFLAPRSIRRPLAVPARPAQEAALGTVDDADSTERELLLDTKTSLPRVTE